MSPSPAFSRLEVDERRRQLLEVGSELFSTLGYEGVSMTGIAARAGISKGLLYHYFASKRDFFVATMREAAEELQARTEPDPAQGDLVAQVRASIEAYLTWIEENALAYTKLMQSVAANAEARSIVEEVRGATRERVLATLAPGRSPAAALRIAVGGWLWFMDGACLDWLEHGDLSRAQMRDLLVAALLGSVGAAHHVDPSLELPLG